MYWDDFEITKREVLASIAIIAMLLIVGLGVSDKISDKIADENEKYNKAIKIESKELFDYGMRTNIGNAFIYGELKAVDPVSYPAIRANTYTSRKLQKSIHNILGRLQLPTAKVKLTQKQKHIGHGMQ